MAEKRYPLPLNGIKARKNTVIRCRFRQNIYIRNTSFLDYLSNKIMAHYATRLLRHV
jgi:hypothetical protein